MDLPTRSWLVWDIRGSLSVRPTSDRVFTCCIGMDCMEQLGSMFRRLPAGIFGRRRGGVR
jgi:hypothetical protein